MDGVIVTKLKKIYHPKGNILHVIKKSDNVKFWGWSKQAKIYSKTVNTRFN